MSFPKNFLWGAATAGHQIEGNNHHSDIWFLENLPNSAYREPSGLACNSYDLWEQDLQIVKDLNLNAFRFSLEWSRIEPIQGHFDQVAIEHYEAIIDRCRELDIEPVVTLNHFSAPHWFSMQAGWLNPKSAEFFACFVRKVIESFGSKLNYVLTLNEPDLPRLLTWLNLPAFIVDRNREMLLQAAEIAGVEKYSSANTVLPEDLDRLEEGLAAGHIEARKVIRELAPELNIGFSIAMTDDRAAVGGELLRDRKRHEVYGRWFELAKGDDFVAVQNYDGSLYGPEGEIEPDQDIPRNGFGGAIDPTSLAGAIRYAYEVSGKPIFVTEHGLGLMNEDDSLRSQFLEDSLALVEREILGEIPVIGYCVWSLLDNFEWGFGYASHFGVVAVDRHTMARVPKPSSGVIAKIRKRQ
ncbi:MAG: hypothetical protein RI917_12 [Actinomycetota bacterium]